MYEDETESDPTGEEHAEVQAAAEARAQAPAEAKPSAKAEPATSTNTTTTTTTGRATELIYEELKDLKERRCSLELATADGWLNTEKQLPAIRKQIEKCMEELTAQGALLPEMHCEKHFEEWHDPPTTNTATTTTTTSPQKSQALPAASASVVATSALLLASLAWL